MSISLFQNFSEVYMKSQLSHALGICPEIDYTRKLKEQKQEKHSSAWHSELESPG